MVQLRQTLLGLSAALLALVIQPASAQTPPCCGAAPVATREACSPAAFCFGLGDAAWLTVGGEFRLRGEALDAVNFGIAGGPESNSVAHRVLLGFDLRTRAGPRAFLQFSFADQTGRKPVVRPFDESDPDIAQGYIDLPFTVGTTKVMLRAGRQELSLGNRLVGLRDGATLRRAFDGVLLDIQSGGHRVIAFRAKPVENRPGDFDDLDTPGETFSGVSWTLPGTPADGILTLYAFDRKRDLARYSQISGPENRQTFGLGYTRTTPRWDMTSQIGVQTGRVADTDVRAWGGYIDVGYHPEAYDGLRIGGQLGIASGDRNPGDNRVGTFDPIYPNLGAYNDAPLYHYANQINLQANVRQTWGVLTLGANATLLARATTRDALYASPGRVLAEPAGGGQLSAVELAFTARWRINDHAELYASFLHAKALDGIRAAGGRDTSFALLQLTIGF
jgi:hypothetical protein